jgi:hypothetical protein
MKNFKYMKKGITIHKFWLILFTISIVSCKASDISNEIEKETNEIKYKVKSLSDVDAYAMELKEKILNSKTSIKATGPTYYVSKNGNDNNSGMSPQNAWATIDKINNTDFISGSAVFFERGGTWRGNIIVKAGISFSAYGEGNKPKIYGSPQNYSVKENWKTTNIPNVYVYDQEIEYDAGVLVFNDGEACSYKKVIGIDGFSGSLNELKNDLEMYHRFDDKKIYIYSTEGNPADRYSSIEFCLWKNIISVGSDNVTIDNLCIKYGGSHGVGAVTRNNLKVTNCEFGWIGGSLQLRNEPTSTTRYGNAIEIYGSCKNYLVDHCYIYQVYDAAITHQYKNKTTETQLRVMENVTYSNNLIEYCTYSIEYFLNQPYSTTDDLMKNILFKNNICRFCGSGWGDQRPNKTAAAHVKSWNAINPAENYVIDNNIFDRSEYMMVHITASKASSLPVMKNNIYIQGSGKDFGLFGVDAVTHYPFNSNIGNILEQNGIEKNPTIIID